MMDASLGQSTQPLLLGKDSYIFRGFLLTVKLFLVLAFVFALFAAACIYRRRLIEREQSSRQRRRLAFRRECGIPDSSHSPLSVARWHAHRRLENATRTAEPARQQVSPEEKRRVIYTRFTAQEKAEDSMVKQAAFLAMSEGKNTTTLENPMTFENSITFQGPITFQDPISFQDPLAPFSLQSRPRPRPRPAHWKSEKELLNSSPWAPNRHQYELGPMPRVEAVNEVQDEPDAIDQALEYYTCAPCPWASRSPLDSQLRDALANHVLEEAEPKSRHVLEVADPEAPIQDKSTRKVSFADEVVQDASGESPVAVGEDESGSHGLPQRGKKRDRAQAGWTLGEDENDASELVTDGSVPLRRTFSRREFDIDVVSSRTQKRGRDSNNNEINSESESETWHPLRRNRHRKSRKHPVRRKLAKRHRKRAIGEEWVEFNIKWKFGPDRELLRQDLVKQLDPADCLPSDSQHIERLLKPEVYVEKWFTLEEHAVAQTRCILIGQETSRQRLAKSKQRAFELNRELERQEYKELPRSINPDSAYWAEIMTDQTPEFPMGFNENLYNELLSLPPIPTPTPADKEGAVEGHTTFGIVSQAAEMPSFPPSSSFTAFAGANNPPSTSIFPPNSSAAVHPTFQSTTPSASWPSNISPHVAFGQSGTLQPTNFSNFPGASIMSDANVAAPAPGSYTTFQSPFSSGPPSNTMTFASGHSQSTISKMNPNPSAFESTAVTNPFINNFPQPAAQPFSYISSGAANQFNPTGFSSGLYNASNTQNPSSATAFFPSGSNAHSQSSMVVFNPQGNVSNTQTMGFNPLMSGFNGSAMAGFGTAGGTPNTNVFCGTTMDANMQVEPVLPTTRVLRPIFKFGQSSSRNTSAASNTISASSSSFATGTPASTTDRQGRPFLLSGTSGGDSNTTEAASTESETQFTFRCILPRS